jgi:hypothetical protein
MGMSRRADLHALFDPDHTIVPPSLEHLPIDAGCTQEVLNRPKVVIGAIGGDQWRSIEAPPDDDVVEDGLGISRGAATEDATRPQVGGTEGWQMTRSARPAHFPLPI